MSKKIFLERRDFEVYTVPVRLGDVFPPVQSKLHALAAAHLEKCHPCFSAESVFETSLCMSKKTLFLRLIVTDCYALAKYRSLYPHKALYIPGKPAPRVFMTENQKRAKKAAVFAVSTALSVLAAAAPSLADTSYSALTAACPFGAGASADISSINTPISAGFTEAGSDGGSGPGSDIEQSDSALFSAVIERLSSLTSEKKEMPNVTGLEYLCDGGFSSLSVSVENASAPFLLTLAQPVCPGVTVSFGTISYSNDKASSAPVYSWKSTRAERDSSIRSEITSAVRSAVIGGGGVLRSERILPVRFDFTVPAEKASACFDMLTAVHRSENIRCSRFSMVLSKERGELVCAIEYSDTSAAARDAAMQDSNASNYPDICAFVSSAVKKKPPAVNTMKKNIPSLGEKIGMIHQQDGKKAVFYKTSGGKIITRMEEL